MRLYRLPTLTLSLISITLPSWADHPTLSLDNGTSSAITTLSAHTLSQGQHSLSLQTQVIDNDSLSEQRLAELAEGGLEDVHSTQTVISHSVSYAYGLSDRLTLGLNLPFIDRQDLTEIHHDDEGGEEDEEEELVERLGDADGLGDLTVYGQYALNLNNSDDQAALLLGLSLPTGKTDVRSPEGERLETELQPGSGGVGVLLGAAYSRRWGPFNLGGNLLYTWNQEGAQDTTLGDILNYNLALSYRLHSHANDHAEHSHGPQWDLILELNGDWRDQVEIGEHTEANTGGNLLFIAPGVRVGWSQRWSAHASVGLPVVKNLHGEQSDPALRVLVGLSRSF